MNNQQTFSEIMGNLHLVLGNLVIGVGKESNIQLVKQTIEQIESLRDIIIKEDLKGD